MGNGEGPEEGRLFDLQYRKDKTPRASTEAGASDDVACLGEVLEIALLALHEGQGHVEHQAPHFQIIGACRESAQNREPSSIPAGMSIPWQREGSVGEGPRHGIGAARSPGQGPVKVTIACTGAWSEGQAPSNRATLTPVRETEIPDVARIQSMRLRSSRGGR